MGILKISDLPEFSKILQKIVLNRCMSYFFFFNRHNIFFENQFAFRPIHSTNMAIAKLNDNINNKQQMLIKQLEVYLWTFPRRLIIYIIRYNILLKELAHYGIRSVVLEILEWFKYYLTNRNQFVDYNSLLWTKI